jgi:hypothetical protein
VREDSRKVFITIITNFHKRVAKRGKETNNRFFRSPTSNRVYFFHSYVLGDFYILIQDINRNINFKYKYCTTLFYWEGRAMRDGLPNFWFWHAAKTGVITLIFWQAWQACALNDFWVSRRHKVLDAVGQDW